MNHCVAALYQFTTLSEPEDRREPLLHFCLAHEIKGTILLANEGINGTICGTDSAINALIKYISCWPEINNLEVKYSASEENCFLRMKVRLKKEIVTMGVENINPLRHAGTYVEPVDWNNLISRPDVVVVDTRNTYETRIGSFAHAIDPETETFRDFPTWADQWASEKPLNKKVAMFCTGGIRCEKASAYMRKIGFNEVYHLKGGILKYLEEVPEDESLWQGECFVFDERVSLGHGLAPGEYELCFACKEPINAADRKEEGFEEGVSCHRCINRYSQEQQQKFRERQRQVHLANARGEQHLGQESISAMRSRRKKQS